MAMMYILSEPCECGGDVAAILTKVKTMNGTKTVIDKGVCVQCLREFCLPPIEPAEFGSGIKLKEIKDV